jgi:hypothetical protein
MLLFFRQLIVKSSEVREKLRSLNKLQMEKIFGNQKDMCLCPNQKAQSIQRLTA